MGLDGFSMGNLGLKVDMTSAQMANQAEQIARKEMEFKVKNVNELAEDSGVKTRDEAQEKDQFSDGFKNKNNEEDEEQNEETQSSISEREFEEKDPKEFSIRINSDTDVVELYSNKDDKVIETINPKDLMGLISKLNNASGILVNRRI